MSWLQAAQLTHLTIYTPHHSSHVCFPISNQQVRHFIATTRCVSCYQFSLKTISGTEDDAANERFRSEQTVFEALAMRKECEESYQILVIISHPHTETDEVYLPTVVGIQQTVMWTVTLYNWLMPCLSRHRTGRDLKLLQHSQLPSFSHYVCFVVWRMKNRRTVICSLVHSLTHSLTHSASFEVFTRSIGRWRAAGHMQGNTDEWVVRLPWSG